MCDLQVQTSSLPEEYVMTDAVSERQVEVEARMVHLIELLKERQRILLAAREVHQVRRDLQDEIVSLQARFSKTTDDTNFKFQS